MRKKYKEIIELTSAKFLLTLFRAAELTAKPFFKASGIYRRSVNDYQQNNDYDIDQINERIHYLKRMGVINTFVENKEKFIELSEAGFKKLKKLSQEIKIDTPQKWDKKWRVVIFDVPEKLRRSRNILRSKLRLLGFQKIQKSVYVFPYPCTDEILAISLSLGIKKHVTIMIAEIIQGEEKIIDNFILSEIIDRKQIKIR